MSAASRRRTLTVEMTSGSLWKNILLFSLPLMMTQVLEVLFNLSDVAIAGKFADYRALGAVGSRDGVHVSRSDHRRLAELLAPVISGLV